MHSEYTTRPKTENPKWKSIAENIREISKENRNFIYALDSSIIQKVIPKLEFEGYIFTFNKKKDNLFYYEIHPNKFRLSQDIKEKIQELEKNYQRKYSDAFIENFVQALKSSNTEEIVSYRNYDDFSNASLDILLLEWYYLNLPRQNKFILYKRPLTLSEWRSKITAEIEDNTHGITSVSMFKDEEFEKEFEEMLKKEELEYSRSHGMYQIFRKDKGSLSTHGMYQFFRKDKGSLSTQENEKDEEYILRAIDKYFENKDHQLLVLYSMELIPGQKEKFESALKERNLKFEIKQKDIWITSKNSHLHHYVDSIISNALSEFYTKSTDHGTMQYPPIEEEDEMQLYNMCLERGIEIQRSPKYYYFLSYKKSNKVIIPESDILRYTSNIEKNKLSANFKSSRRVMSIYNEIASLIRKEKKIEYKILKKFNIAEKIVQLLRERDLDVKLENISQDYYSIVASIKENPPENPPLIFDNLCLSKMNSDIIRDLNSISSHLLELPHGRKFQVNLNPELKQKDAIAIAHKLGGFLYDTDIYFSKTDDGKEYYAL